MGRLYKLAHGFAVLHPFCSLESAQGDTRATGARDHGVGACGAETTGHPLNTGAIPADAEVLDKCTKLGEMACSLVSGAHGDAGLERRSACVAYVSPNGTRTEQCGSVPVSQPEQSVYTLAR